MTVVVGRVARDLVLRVEELPDRVWRGGEPVLPFGDVHVADPTDGGDSPVVGLVAAVQGGAEPGGGRSARSRGVREHPAAAGRPGLPA